MKPRKFKSDKELMAFLLSGGSIKTAGAKNGLIYRIDAYTDEVSLLKQQIAMLKKKLKASNEMV